MLTQIIISTTPIIAYSIFLFWTNRLINSKLTNKGDRKKYKKYFNKLLGEFFAPIFLFSVLLATILFPKPDTWVILGIILFITKILLMLVQGVISIGTFTEIKDEIQKIKTETVENILKDIEDK